ncbi:hypothetical protein jhhlp_001287 [Lomentospora prolificans]|uniref:Phospholipase/carboxylesterase/thioesterase domain-containing protein n=1 Tax=Lomentospora prolificans TaxID=41688 RepID=A0A2N3NHV9_9PEZI|nr:hypothetical protein jhhlp_001287 [Lomentospora prolificans]
MDKATMIQSAHNPVSTTFGPPLIFHPRTQHTHTIVMLHGRGSTGPEFAGELFESTTLTHESLQDSLPGWRWVFPSAKELWSTTFQEAMPAWFETTSSIDPSSRPESQMPLIQESVEHILQILQEESEMLRGRSEKVILGGISQGGAVAMWTLLCRLIKGDKPLGGFVGISTWLPFSADIRNSRDQKARLENEKHAGIILVTLTALHNKLQNEKAKPLFSQLPIYIGHGNDDAYVGIELGRDAADLLSTIGLEVEWNEYTGAEQEGHWIKVPEEVDDIIGFLRKI